jgi:hypothetical protein
MYYFMDGGSRYFKLTSHSRHAVVLVVRYVPPNNSFFLGVGEQLCKAAITLPIYLIFNVVYLTTAHQMLWVNAPGIVTGVPHNYTN